MAKALVDLGVFCLAGFHAAIHAETWQLPKPPGSHFRMIRGRPSQNMLFPQMISDSAPAGGRTGSFPAYPFSFCPKPNLSSIHSEQSLHFQVRVLIHSLLPGDIYSDLEKDQRKVNQGNSSGYTVHIYYENFHIESISQWAQGPHIALL